MGAKHDPPRAQDMGNANRMTPGERNAAIKTLIDYSQKYAEAREQSPREDAAKKPS